MKSAKKIRLFFFWGGGGGYSVLVIANVSKFSMRNSSNGVFCVGSDQCSMRISNSGGVGVIQHRIPPILWDFDSIPPLGQA